MMMKDDSKYDQSYPSENQITNKNSRSSNGDGWSAARIKYELAERGQRADRPLGADRRIRELGERAAAMTHGHVDGFKPAGDMAQMIAALILCRDEHSIADALPGKSADPSLTAAALAHREADLDICRGQVARLGEGWVGDEALAIGLFSFLAGANDYRRTIRIACNHCGDSDSTASFAGQLYGARHGVAGIPSDWIMRLDVLEPLLWLAGEFIRWEASH